MKQKLIKEILPKFNGLFSQIVDPVYGEELNPVVLDIDYITKAGERKASPLVMNFVDEETGKIEPTELTLLANYIHQKYKRSWERYGIINTTDYDPTETYDLVETETLMGSESGTLTLDGTIIKTIDNTRDNTDKQEYVREGEILTDRSEESGGTFNTTRGEDQAQTGTDILSKAGSIDVTKADDGTTTNNGTRNTTDILSKTGSIDVTKADDGTTTNNGTKNTTDTLTKEGSIDVTKQDSYTKDNTGTSKQLYDTTEAEDTTQTLTPSGEKTTSLQQAKTTTVEGTDGVINVTEGKEGFGFGSSEPKQTETTTTDTDDDTTVTTTITKDGPDTTTESFDLYNEETQTSGQKTKSGTDTRTDNLSETTTGTGTEVTSFTDYKETTESDQTDSLTETRSNEGTETTSFTDYKETTESDQTDNLTETRSNEGTESTSFTDYKETKTLDLNNNTTGTETGQDTRTGAGTESVSFNDYKETTDNTRAETVSGSETDKTDNVTTDERSNTQERTKITRGDMGVKPVSDLLRQEYEWWKGWNIIDAILADVIRETTLDVVRRK